MSANFTPTLHEYTDLTPFRFWCQKILPLAYDDSLSYYELLCKVVDYLNKTMEDVTLSIEDVQNLHTAYVALQGYVNNYFNNLDVQEEINNKLDALVADGTIHTIFTPDVMAILNIAQQASLDAIADIPDEVTAWLAQHITQETGYVIDNTLTVSGAAADAKVTGGRLDALKSDLSDLNNVVRGTFYELKAAGGTLAYNINIAKGTRIRITNNRSANASAQLKNSENTVVQNIGTITANSTVYVTVTADGVTQISGYCSGGYNATLFVENPDSVVRELARVIKPVSALTANEFRKGNLSATDTYRAANRASTKFIYYADKNIVLGRTPDASAAVVNYITYNPDGTEATNIGWKEDIYIPKGTLFRLILSESNSGTATEKTVDEILACFAVKVYDTTVNDSFYHKVMLIGTLYTDNGYNVFTSNGRILSVLDFLTVDKAFLRITVDTGYICLIYLYDKEFNFLYARQINSGTKYVDCSDAAYMRFSLQVNDTSATITYSDISHLQVTKNKPVSVEYHRNGNVQSIAKDGINDNSLDWAPAYPKSSPVSFQKAYDQGFRSLLIHVQFTSDGYPVLFHDENIAQRGFVKNADGTAISGAVYIRNTTLAQLDTYDFGIAFGSQYAGMKITRLDEGLEFAKSHGMYLFIEPTSSLTYEQQAEVANRVKWYGLAKNCGFHGYGIGNLENFHGHIPEADLYWSPTSSDYRVQYWSRFVALQNEYNTLYMYGIAGMTDDEILEAVKNGIRFGVQIENGIEPENYISILDTRNFYSSVVSYVVPAYSALQKS